MFGGGLTVPVPDIDRTDFLLILGANPYASNGSLATAPDWPGRLEALKARGGRLVVVDPRRSRTAEEADEHVAIRPGTDAFLLAALVHHAGRGGPRRPAARAEHLAGLDEVLAALGAVHPGGGGRRDRRRRRGHPPAGPRPGRRAHRRRSTAASARRTAEFGTLASWLVDVVNVCTGNLDRPGGAMFTKAAVGAVEHAGHAAGRPGHPARPPPQPGPRAARVARASCRWCAWPRRSTRRARARCGR